jgi:hypothetical protein
MGDKDMHKILIELQFETRPTQEEVNQRLKRILERDGKVPYMELDMTTIENMKRLNHVFGLGMHELGV